jgi:hypothetical protein
VALQFVTYWLYAHADGVLQASHILSADLKNPSSHPHTQLYRTLPDHSQDEYNGLSASLHLAHRAAAVVLQFIRYSFGLQTGFVPHCEQSTAFEVAAYFPLSQMVHAVAPSNEAYVPETQTVQFMELTDPVMDENFPAVQYSHVVKPEVLEYLPGPHNWHTTFVDEVQTIAA